MKKIFIPYNISDYTAGGTIAVSGDDHNHIAHSLRAGIGERFIVGDSDGNEMLCTIVQITNRDVVFSADARYIRKSPPIDLVMAFALLKGDKNEQIIRRCTEIGVSRFIPVAMHNCVMRVDDKSALAKLSKWQTAARESSMQSGRQFIPTVDPVMTIEQLCRTDLPRHRYYGRILSDASLGSALSDLSDSGAAVCIGPEGDFTAAEEQALNDSGWCGISCPADVMRSETAAMYFASVVSFAMHNLRHD